jgi:WD40 repeat protein
MQKFKTLLVFFVICCISLFLWFLYDLLNDPFAEPMFTTIRAGSGFIEIRVVSGTVDVVVFSPDGEKIATSDAHGNVRIHDAKSGRTLRNLRHIDVYVYVVFSPDGKKVATVHHNDGEYDQDVVRIWDVRSGRELTRLIGHMYTGFVIDRVAFSPDGKKIVTAGPDQTARIWDAESGKELRILDHETVDSVVYADVVYAAFSQDGKKIVTATSDEKAVRIWEVESGEELQKFMFSGGLGGFGCLSPDWKKLCALDRLNHVVYIREVESGVELQRLVGHTDRVTTVEFSLDGKKIVTASHDHTARIWDAKSGKELKRLEGHSKKVVFATFSPDGKRIATSSVDGTARIWDWERYISPLPNSPVTDI